MTYTQTVTREHLIPGGKSLTGDGQHSPILHVRLPAALKQRLDEIAADRKMGTSKLVRQILTDWADTQP